MEPEGERHGDTRELMRCRKARNGGRAQWGTAKGTRETGCERRKHDGRDKMNEGRKEEEVLMDE